MKFIKIIIVYTIVLAGNLTHSVFPDIPSLETKRLILRKITLQDTDDFFLFTSNRQVCALTGMFDLHTTLEETQEYIKRMIDRYSQEKGTAAYWTIEDKTTHKAIGIIGIFGYMANYARAEIGYALAQESWGKGLATEAVAQVLYYGFKHMQLNRIQACTDKNNSASKRVLEKNNMQYEGCLRDYMIVQGKPVDRLMFSLLKRDFDQASSSAKH
jgi:ribosomal-protein-alanine N-acetyltransferase